MDRRSFLRSSTAVAALAGLPAVLTARRTKFVEVYRDGVWMVAPHGLQHLEVGDLIRMRLVEGMELLPFCPDEPTSTIGRIASPVTWANNVPEVVDGGCYRCEVDAFVSVDEALAVVA